MEYDCSKSIEMLERVRNNDGKIQVDFQVDYFSIYDDICSTLKNDMTLSFLVFMFNTIVKQCIPEYLFKFYSLSDDIDLNDNKLRTLQAGNVFLSEATKLNDPFDLNAIFYDTDVLNKLISKKPDILQGLFDLDTVTGMTISSFTQNDENNAMMWAYYSNNHNGYCVKYKMDWKSNDNLGKFMFPIQYVSERKDMTNILLNLYSHFISTIESYSHYKDD